VLDTARFGSPAKSNSQNIHLNRTVARFSFATFGSTEYHQHPFDEKVRSSRDGGIAMAGATDASCRTEDQKGSASWCRLVVFLTLRACFSACTRVATATEQLTADQIGKLEDEWVVAG
jgi:hypothetical protein